MYAVIRQYKFDEQNTREIDKRIQEIFVPQLEKAPGFISYNWLDTGRGEGASCSVFEDKAGTVESTRLAAEFVKEHLQNFNFSSPQIIEGVVQAHSEREPGIPKAKDMGASARPSPH